MTQQPYQNFCVYACVEMLRPRNTMIEYAHWIQHKRYWKPYSSYNSGCDLYASPCSRWVEDKPVNGDEMDLLFELCGYTYQEWHSFQVRSVLSRVLDFSEAVVVLEGEGTASSPGHAVVITGATFLKNDLVCCTVNDPQFGKPTLKYYRYTDGMNVYWR